MISFKQFIIERFKSEHEDKIRQITSGARRESLKRKPERTSKWGDCTNVSVDDNQVDIRKERLKFVRT